MENYFLELLLIAEKGKIDEYVKNTKKHWGDVSDEEVEGLCQSFLWGSTREGFVFWEEIRDEAEALSEE